MESKVPSPNSNPKQTPWENKVDRAVASLERFYNKQFSGRFGAAKLALSVAAVGIVAFTTIYFVRSRVETVFTSEMTDSVRVREFRYEDLSKHLKNMDSATRVSVNGFLTRAKSSMYDANQAILKRYADGRPVRGFVSSAEYDAVLKYLQMTDKELDSAQHYIESRIQSNILR